MGSVQEEEEPPLPMNPTWPDQPPKIQYLTEMTDKDMDYTRTPSADRSYSYKERFDIDNYEIKKQFYNESTLKKDDEHHHHTLEHARMKDNVEALKSHREWGGVDARQIHGTVTQIKDRSKIKQIVHPVYAATPTNELEFPFDARDVTKFVGECKRRLNNKDCATVKVHGNHRPVIALYGMPCSPFQEVYHTSNSTEHKRKCVGFGNVNYCRKLKEQMQQEGTHNTINRRHTMVNGPPAYTKHWRMHVHNIPIQGESKVEVVEGSHNIARPLVQTNYIEYVLPTSGFWSDPLTGVGMELLHINTRNTINNDAQYDLFKQMATSNGVVLRGNKPAYNYESIPNAKKGTRQANHKYKEYPQLDFLLSEAYTTLTAAACGLHPPVFALLIVQIEKTKGIMLSLTELGTKIFPLSKLTRTNGSSFEFKLRDSIQLHQRQEIAKHISKRLSDLIFRSSDLGFMTIDIKHQNLVAMYPYKIANLHPAKYMDSSHIDTNWIAMDVMHIDCNPTYTCFIPRTVNQNNKGQVAFQFVLNRTSGYVYTYKTDELKEDYYMVQSACIRLITLFMTLLHSLCKTFKLSTEKRASTINQLIYLSYEQLFVDIKQILRNRKSDSFGPICNGLFTQSDWDAVLELQNKTPEDRSKRIQEELQSGWKTVSNLNNNRDATNMWNSIANLIKYQMKHYWLTAAFAALSKNPEQYCTSALYNTLNHMSNDDPKPQSKKHRFQMKIENAFVMYGTPSTETETLSTNVDKIKAAIQDNFEQHVKIQKIYQQNETGPIYVEYTRETDRPHRPQTDLKLCMEKICGKDSIIEIKREGQVQKTLRTSAFEYKKDLVERQQHTNKYHSDMFMMLTGFLGYGLTQLAKQISFQDPNP
jgi:hypothetical protein